MYENTGVFQVSGIFYPTTYYTLGMGCTQYVNGIFNFMCNNHCCMYDSGVLEQQKMYGYEYRINKGDIVMLELDTKEKKLYFFLNGKLLPFVLTEVPLPVCFLIVSVCKGDEIEFKFIRHLWTSSYETNFSSPDKEIKWITNNNLII
jgi:hypothetical protein